MSAQDIINSLTDEDIIKYLTHLGAETFINRDSEIIFPTVCHNDFYDNLKMKLYYYKSNKRFFCYTECEAIGNIFELTKLKFDMDFREAFEYVCEFFNIGKTTRQIKGFGLNVKHNAKDLEIINKYIDRDTINPILPIIKEDGFLYSFIKFYHGDWLNDNISKNSMDKYNIKYCLEQQKIIIPHYDEFNRLVGVRCRSFDEFDLEQGRKYMPYMDIETKIMYNHSLRHNLYGLNHNKGAIKKHKKVVLVESEKGVLQADTFLGNENIVVAICGSNVSKYQRDLLLELNVDEVILGFDKQYKVLGDKECIAWDKKIKKIASLFTPFVSFSVIRDYNNLLEYKDSPTDRGEEVYKELFKSREIFVGEDLCLDIS